MLNDSVNIEKYITIYLLNICVITENAKLREIKHHKRLRQLTPPNPIIYYYNQAN
jgi:hypothetical protein